MKIFREESLRDFDFWSGAATNAEELDYDQLDELESILEDIYPNGISATELNDLMWFDFDTIKEWLGIENDDEDEFDESINKVGSSIKEYINNSDDEEIINKIARKLRLDATETEDFIHDINNLRGDEWLDYIEDECPEYLDHFKLIADIQNDEFDEGCHRKKSKSKKVRKEMRMSKTSKLAIKEDTKKPYIYFTKHGVGPGMLPKDVKIIDWYDVNNYITLIYTDRFLTTKELNDFDIYPETKNSELMDRYNLELDTETGRVYAK